MVLGVTRSASACVFCYLYLREAPKMSKWVLTEMEENREEAKNKSPEAPVKKYWVPRDDEKEFDPRGCRSYVESDKYLAAPWEEEEESSSSKSFKKFTVKEEGELAQASFDVEF